MPARIRNFKRLLNFRDWDCVSRINLRPGVQIAKMPSSVGRVPASLVRAGRVVKVTPHHKLARHSGGFVPTQQLPVPAANPAQPVVPLSLKGRQQRLEENALTAALVRRCILGDAGAWEELVRQQNRRIYNICYRFTGSSSDAEDLTQEVFIRL